MKNVPGTMLLAVTVLAGAIVVATWWNTRPDRAAPASESEDVVEWSAPGPLGDPASQRPANPTFPASPALQSPEDLAAQRAAEQMEVKHLVDAGRNKLYAQYQSERVDSRWALAKERALERDSTSLLIEELNAAPMSINAHCRSSVCRIEAHFATLLAATDWFNLYTMNVGQEMTHVSMQQTSNPDGSVRLELYGFARP